MEKRYTAAVITVSDRCSRGEQEDTSGPAVAALMRDNGYEVISAVIVPDEEDMIAAEMIRCADALHADIILATGGTGFSPRDVTPEATRRVIERETPYIPLAMVSASLRITPRAMLTRMTAGIRGSSLILDLPGSRKAAVENLSSVVGTLDHALQMLAGGGH